jgi:hypothetical protein
MVPYLSKDGVSVKVLTTTFYLRMGKSEQVATHIAFDIGCL